MVEFMPEEPVLPEPWARAAAIGAMVNAAAKAIA
jgi:hypothetical protein